MKQVPAHGYLTSEELRQNDAKLRHYYVATPAWVVVEGHAARYLEKNLDRAAKVLDVGASGGDFLADLAAKGFQNLAAVDISDFCTKNLGPLAEFRAVDVSREPLPYPDASFDAVTALSIFEHLENPFQACREVHRVLKENGIFILSVPNAFHIWSKLSFLRRGDLTDWNLRNAHISFLPKAVFAKTFLRYFRVEARVYQNGFVPYFPKFKTPRTEFFGRRVCFFLRKISGEAQAVPEQNLGQ